YLTCAALPCPFSQSPSHIAAHTYTHTRTHTRTHTHTHRETSINHKKIILIYSTNESYEHRTQSNPRCLIKKKKKIFPISLRPRHTTPCLPSHNTRHIAP